MITPLERAIAFHRQGQIEQALAAAQEGLSRNDADLGLLHFVGMVEGARGNVRRACEMLERAAEASTSFGPVHVSLARLLARAGEHERLAALTHEPLEGELGNEFLWLRASARSETGDADGAMADLSCLADRDPANANLTVAAARACSNAGKFEEAESYYRRALDVAPANTGALLGVTGLLESLARAAELQPIFSAAARAGASTDVLALGEAIRLREAGEFALALEALEQARSALPEGTFEQMKGELADRSGDEVAAFTAFQRMNAADAAEYPQLWEGVRRFQSELEAAAPLPARDSAQTRPPPLFLVGFPRSGTTLLDTFLMGHPSVRVHEERPYLQQAIMSAGGAQAKAKAYWDALDREAPTTSPKLEVDKNPLASARADQILSMFPQARFIFTIRHPCDVVLSCFLTRFRLNYAIAAFVDLEEAAKLYDRVMRKWSSAERQIEDRVCRVRYENLLSEPAATLRSVCDFAGLTFTAEMLDHQATAVRRGYISSASNAQVREPLYRRSVGRWKRYREQLAPVLPILAPWCERFDYPID